MPLTTLKDDLMQEFREERIMINEQIELLDPLATSLRKPEAQRLLSSGTLILTEIFCYLLSLSGIAFLCFMYRIYPFSLLNTILYNPQLRNTLGAPDLFYLILGVYGIACIGILFIFIAGRMARTVRLKNDILHVAGKDIKTIVGQHLERKAILDTIEQRHLLGLSGISIPTPKQSMAIHEVANPGFE